LEEPVEGLLVASGSTEDRIPIREIGGEFISAPDVNLIRQQQALSSVVAEGVLVGAPVSVLTSLPLIRA